MITKKILFPAPPPPPPISLNFKTESVGGGGSCHLKLGEEARNHTVRPQMHPKAGFHALTRQGYCSQTSGN